MDLDDEEIIGGHGLDIERWSLILVIAQQIVEKKGQDHDFARTGYVHFHLILASIVVGDGECGHFRGYQWPFCGLYYPRRWPHIHWIISRTKDKARNILVLDSPSHPILSLILHLLSHCWPFFPLYGYNVLQPLTSFEDL